MALECKHCGSEFPRKKYGPPAKFCTPVCKSRHHSARYKENGRAAELYAAKRAELDKRSPRPTCNYCGTEMSRNRSVQCGSPECEREHRHRCYMNNREWYRDWWQSYSAAHPERVRENKYKHAHIRRARLRELPSDGTGPREWSALMEEADEWRCGLCGGDFRPGDELHWDHIDPLSTGSRGNVVSNVHPTHGSCNMSRQNLPISVWRKRSGIPDYV